jgi:hypothetical protein
MKKKILFVVLLISFVYAVFGQNLGDFEYSENGGKITITGYKGSVKSVVIPEKINGLPVVAIGDYAFPCNHLTSITLPNSVTYIGDYAFKDNSITSVVIPNSVKSLSNYAFDFNVRITRR